MRILGLDPGSRHTGFGLVERHGGKLVGLACGRFSPPRDHPLAQRLALVCDELEALLDRWQPTLVVLESVFHSRNVRSLIVLSQVRGALLSMVARRGLALDEYSPAEVKSAVAGNGRAPKAQIERMVRLRLGISEGLSEDAADALAVALCAAQRARLDALSGRRTGSARQS